MYRLLKNNLGRSDEKGKRNKVKENCQNRESDTVSRNILPDDYSVIAKYVAIEMRNRYIVLDINRY